jgi:hypothetical protein
MMRALALGAVLGIATSAVAQGGKPKVPPGRDPGGVPIALITTGIDYTHPKVAQGLARDGEGELMGFDLVDNDNRPFGAARAEALAHRGDDTMLAVHLADPPAGIRMVPVRVDPRRPETLAGAVTFIARTPARVVVVPLSSRSKEEWRLFRLAAERAAQLMFIVAAGDDGRDLDSDPSYPAGLGLPNATVVTAARMVDATPASARLLDNANWGARTVDAVAIASHSTLAAGAAARAAATLLAQGARLSGADLKRRLLELSHLQRGAETPQRTRTLVILTPVQHKPAWTTPDPADRLRDKARIPERIHKSAPAQQDGSRP